MQLSQLSSELFPDEIWLKILNACEDRSFVRLSCATSHLQSLSCDKEFDPIKSRIASACVKKFKAQKVDEEKMAGLRSVENWEVVLGNEIKVKRDFKHVFIWGDSYHYTSIEVENIYSKEKVFTQIIKDANDLNNRIEEIKFNIGFGKQEENYLAVRLSQQGWIYFAPSQSMLQKLIKAAWNLIANFT